MISQDKIEKLLFETGGKPIGEGEINVAIDKLEVLGEIPPSDIWVVLLLYSEDPMLTPQRTVIVSGFDKEELVENLKKELGISQRGVDRPLSGIFQYFKLIPVSRSEIELIKDFLRQKGCEFKNF